MTYTQAARLAPTQQPPAEGSFDLRREIDKLRAGAPYREHGHAARTLIKAPALRIVLVALKRGNRLAEHTVAEPVSLHVLDGHIRVDVDGVARDQGVGHLMSIQRGVTHDVEALTDAAFLLTLPWTADAN